MKKLIIIALLFLLSCGTCTKPPAPAPDYRVSFLEWPAWMAQAYGLPHIEGTMQVWKVEAADTIRTDSTLRFSNKHVYTGYRVPGQHSARCSGSWRLVDSARLEISWFYPAIWCETFDLYSYPGWWQMASDKGRELWFKSY